MEPYEIISAPFTLYLAPVGEDFPDIDADPDGNWVKVGTSGDRNYNEDGVTVSHGQTIEEFRMLGSTGPVKAARTEETLTVGLTLHDMTLEQYKHALNSNTVDTTAAGVGDAGFKEVPLYRGREVATHALLVRGDVSPEGDGWKTQYELPVVYQSAEPEPVFQKGSPAGLALTFTAIEDPDAASADARFGRLVVQHEDALEE